MLIKLSLVYLHVVVVNLTQDRDGAEMLLKSEHTHLLSLKASLEGHLRNVKQLLHELNTSRANLASVLQERSRATDLLCQSMGGGNGGGSRGGSMSSLSFKKTSLPPLHQNPATSSTKLQMLEGGGAKAMHSKAYSAPAPMEVGKGWDRSAMMERSASEAELVGKF